MLILEAMPRFECDGVLYLALYAGFPASDPASVAPEFSVERVLEEVVEDGEKCIRLAKLIIKDENDEAIKTAER